MFAWLMPFVLLSVTFGGCPGPSQVSCDGTACLAPEPGCCPNNCGGYTMGGSPPVLGGSPPVLGGSPPVLSRLARGVDCTDEEEGRIEPDGCKMCVCKYNRRECIYKGCRACLVTAGNSTLKYSHGDEFQSGCLECTCRDGQLDCNHDSCDKCTHRGNSTLSGQRKEFGCGTCDCFDGQWTCDATCGVNSAQGPRPLVLLTFLAVWRCYIQ